MHVSKRWTFDGHSPRGREREREKNPIPLGSFHFSSQKESEDFGGGATLHPKHARRRKRLLMGESGLENGKFLL